MTSEMCAHNSAESASGESGEWCACSLTLSLPVKCSLYAIQIIVALFNFPPSSSVRLYVAAFQISCYHRPCDRRIVRKKKNWKFIALTFYRRRACSHYICIFPNWDICVDGWNVNERILLLFYVRLTSLRLLRANVARRWNIEWNYFVWSTWFVNSTNSHTHIIHCWKHEIQITSHCHSNVRVSKTLNFELAMQRRGSEATNSCNWILSV